MIFALLHHTPARLRAFSVWFSSAEEAMVVVSVSACFDAIVRSTWAAKIAMTATKQVCMLELDGGCLWN